MVEDRDVVRDGMKPWPSVDRVWVDALVGEYTRIEAKTPAPPDTNAAPQHTDNYAELIEAARLLDKRTLLGDYGSFIRPFSQQYKRQIRGYSPEDAAIFQETDRQEDRALGLAWQLRRTTLLIFLSFSLFLFVPIAQARLNFVPHYPWAGLASFLSVAALATVARLLVRDKFLGMIGSSATMFGNYFIKELTSIFDRADNAVSQSTKDQMMTQGWPERSGGWIKIALFFEKRSENIDRYVTATAWRVESWYGIIEGLFIVLEYALVVSVTLLAILIIGLPLFAGGSFNSATIFAVIGVLLYPALSIAFWGMKPQKNNALWSIRFRNSVKGFDERRNHIYAQIANVIAVDKRFLMSTTRSGGPGPSKET